MNLNPKP